MNRSDFRHAERLRVRWAEVDLQHIVFNGHYLMYFDTAVAGWWRAMALPYHLTMQGMEGDLYVRKATLEYEGSARYDDQLEVGVRCARIGNSSMVVQAAVFREGRRLVHGELVYVFADPATQTSRPVPQRLREAVLGFEAGEPTLTVLEGTEAPGGDALTDEEGARLLADNTAGAGAWHVAVRNRLGLTVARARLAATRQGLARIEHLAVRPSLQGSGIGLRMLDVLVAAAAQRDVRRLQVFAPGSAVPFFVRAGFAPAAAGALPDAERRVTLERAV